VLIQTLYMRPPVWAGGCAMAAHIDLFAKMTGIEFHIEGPVGLCARRQNRSLRLVVAVLLELSLGRGSLPLIALDRCSRYVPDRNKKSVCRLGDPRRRHDVAGQAWRGGAVGRPWHWLLRPARLHWPRFSTTVGVPGLQILITAASSAIVSKTSGVSGNRHALICFECRQTAVPRPDRSQ